MALCGPFAPRRLDENLPHQLRADREEMFAILELVSALFREAQICLMHQSGAGTKLLNSPSQHNDPNEQYVTYAWRCCKVR